MMLLGGLDAIVHVDLRHIVDILDKYERIDFISLTKAEQEGLLDKIPVHQRYKSFHLIFPKGDAKSGSEGLN